MRIGKWAILPLLILAACTATEPIEPVCTNTLTGNSGQDSVFVVPCNNNSLRAE